MFTDIVYPYLTFADSDRNAEYSRKDRDASTSTTRNYDGTSEGPRCGTKNNATCLEFGSKDLQSLACR